MATTTQRVYNKNMNTIRRWMKKLNIKTFAELIDKWTIEVDLHQKRMFYDKLTPIMLGCAKPLSGKRLGKMYTK